MFSIFAEVFKVNKGCKVSLICGCKDTNKYSDNLRISDKTFEFCAKMRYIVRLWAVVSSPCRTFAAAKGT